MVFKKILRLFKRVFKIKRRYKRRSKRFNKARKARTRRSPAGKLKKSSKSKQKKLKKPKKPKKLKKPKNLKKHKKPKKQRKISDKAISKNKKSVLNKRAFKGVSAGVITHYFPKVNAAVIKVTKAIRIGDPVMIRSKGKEQRQMVSSMQIDRRPIEIARPGQEIGLEVLAEVKPGDELFIVKG